MVEHKLHFGRKNDIYQVLVYYRVSEIAKEREREREREREKERERKGERGREHLYTSKINRF